MVLTVNVQNGDVVTLRCAGRVVRGVEASILCAAVQQFGRDVTLDLSEVNEIDGAGVGALIALQAAGVYLKLKGLAEQVRETLIRMGADSVFEINEGSEQRSLAASPMQQAAVA